MDASTDAEGFVARYKYQPLENATGEIRLLHLLPGQRNSTLKIQLHVQAVDSASGLQYEALSYTWGSIDDPAMILIETDHGSQALSVTQNCWLAVQNLRVEDSVRILWIDAVCIDQTNIVERSQQVSIMGDVYSRALHTIVWLGEASANTHLAMSWMERLSHHVTWELGTDLSPLTDEYQWVNGDRAHITDEETDAMADLASRPWFSRLWVWQEVRLSDSRAILTCGAASVPWRSFHMAMRSLYGKMFPQTPSFDILSVHIDRLYERLNWVGFSVIGLLSNVRGCSCTDQRDRIYATQTNAPTAAEITVGHSVTPSKVIPDYRLSVADVYTDFILRYIEARNDLGFFAAVTEKHRRVGGESPLDDPPSWVPDWSQARATNPFRFKAHSFCNITGVYADRKLLRIKGVVDSRVISCMPFGLDIDESGSFDDLAQALHNLIKSTPEMTSDDKSLGNLCDVLLAGFHHEAFERPPSLAHHMDVLRRVVRQLPDLRRSDAEHYRVASQMGWNCYGRSLFRTDGGDIGLGPSAMKPEDVVAFFPGYGHPIVLRESHRGHHQFVGSAHVHGFRYVEKLWGTLPPTHEAVHTSWPGGYRIAYRELGTDKVTVMDPRVTQLRPGWEDPHIPNVYYEERDRNTGESRWRHRDMRCTPDELKTLGADLIEFTLE